MRIIGFILNLPYTLIGFLVALASIPKSVRFNQKPLALVLGIKKFWWAIGYMKHARAMAIGHVVLLGPNIEDKDLEHELVHVRQHERMPLIQPILYYIELFRKGYRNNKYEEEAYRVAGNVYKESNTGWTKTLNKDRASGIVIKDSKVLLIHRIREDREYWVFPGGGIEENETIEEALDREMSEELGIKIKEKRFLFEIENAGRSEHYFLITTYEGEPEEIGGPEKERMNDENQYILEWIDLSKIPDIPDLYPREAIIKLQEFLRTQK